MVISALCHKSKFNFELFWKKCKFWGFPCCSTDEYLSIDVSITNVRLILTKLRWYQLFGTSLNSISNFFEKKIQVYGYPWCILVKTFPLVYQLLMQDWYWRTQGDFFPVGTDRQTRFWNPNMETCRHTKNFNSKFKIRSYLAVNPYMPPQRTGMHIYQNQLLNK